MVNSIINHYLFVGCLCILAIIGALFLCLVGVVAIEEWRRIRSFRNGELEERHIVVSYLRRAEGSVDNYGMYELGTEIDEKKHLAWYKEARAAWSRSYKKNLEKDKPVDAHHPWWHIWP